MKRKILLHFVFALSMLQLFSCSSAEYYRFAPSQEQAYNKVKEKSDAAVKVGKSPTALSETVFSDAPADLTVPESEPLLEASLYASKSAELPLRRTAVKPETAEKRSLLYKTELTAQETAALTEVKNQLTQLNKAEKEEIKKGIKAALPDNITGTNILEIILAFLIPPLAVFLHEGINNKFWISLILTLLFFIPGVIYALLVVTDNI